MRLFADKSKIGRHVAHLSACLAAVLLLGGCDNNPLNPQFKEKKADGTPWITYYRAYPDDPRSLDPQVTYDEVSHNVVSAVYDTFLTYKPFQLEYELIPDLAAEMPVLEKKTDGTASYTCKIKPGMFFQADPCFPGGKGREITSQDFVYVFQRMTDPRVECPIASTLQDFLVGMTDLWNAAQKDGKFDYNAPYPCVETVDRYTFRINLLKPYPQIRYWLAFPFTAPVAREAVEYYDGQVHDGAQREQFKFHPVGTGPWRLTEWKHNSLIRLIRNDAYSAMTFPTGGWPAEHADRYIPHAGKKLPLVDEVQLIVMRESIPAWILFKQGWTDGSGVGKDVFNSVITTSKDLSPEYKARGIELEKDVELSTFYLMFNMQDPVLGTNKKLRQALSLVYDSEAANQIFYNGIWQNAQQLPPPGMFGYDKDFINPYRQTNTEKAKQLLTEAGYPNGIDPKTGEPLTLAFDVTADSGASRQMAEYDKSQFEKLGIRVRIVENIFAQMIEKQNRGTFQFLAAGWNADYPDPENFYFLFYGPNMPPRGYNQCRYDNPEFNKLYEQMANMEDSPERGDLLTRMRNIMTEDAVIAPFWNPTVFSLKQPWAKQIVVNALVAKSSGLKYAWVDAPLREIERAKLNRKNYWPLAVGLLLIVFAIIYGIKRRSQANV